MKGKGGGQWGSRTPTETPAAASPRQALAPGPGGALREGLQPAASAGWDSVTVLSSALFTQVQVMFLEMPV